MAADCGCAGAHGTSDDKFLPASVRKKDNQDHRRHYRIVAASNDKFLQDLHDDLSVDRIDDIYQHLWVVGRPYLPRPLNTQKVLNREIIPTNDTSLHLIWTSGKIYMKPLPRCLQCQAFYNKHLHRARKREGPALGLIYSYIALLPSELDFEIAREANLVSKDFQWEDWKRLVRLVLRDYEDNILDHVPKRYEYGELRLDRLDKIYRYFCGQWLHGYSNLTSNTRYGDFFRKNIGVIGASTVYLVVIISAMSLGRTTKTLKDDVTFERACYGFAVFAILLPVVGIGLVLATFVFIFIANYVKTLAAQRKHRQCPAIQSIELKQGGERNVVGVVNDQGIEQQV